MLRQSSYVAIAAAGGLGLVFAGPAKSEFFSGPYIGVEGDLTSAVTFLDKDEGEDEDGDIVESENTRGAEDLLAGGSVIFGWGQQERGFYYGLEARYSFGDKDGEGEDTYHHGEGEVLIDSDFELGNGHSVAARLGSLLYDGNVMLYGSLGYVEREFSVSAEGVEEGQEFDLDGDEDFSGYRAAVGMEYRPTNAPIRVHVEGSRSDLGGETIDLGDDEAEIDDLVENSFHVGVAYTFE
ncbi:outer membrane protein [Halorhodospira halochloris]|uniref:outer membrane protein n=1 Tax=Halorhodospira halochloris TaxID=1052 RepID=UPI001EE99718|nr:outer membrane beta-barrel protein [Halorhodospira halochloris]MCG5547767.1 outer membrane beta-barrel protein [Halorhodospira halochloris]